MRQFSRLKAPKLASTMAGRRLLRQSGIVVGAFMLGYLLTVFVLFPAPLFSADHSVPRVLDEGVSAAREKVEKLGFRVKVDDELPHPRAPKGTIIWQDPPPGVILEKGGSVHLTPSSGPAPVAVPDLIGLDGQLAARVLDASGLTLGGVDSTPSNADPGSVIATRPGAGIARDPGTPIGLVVSNGPAEINVPDVIGMSNQQARERIERAGLAVQDVTWRSVPNKPEGLVLEQRPAPGTLSPRGGKVQLILSRRPKP